MLRDEWYRRTTWTQTDRTDFYERLSRSRGKFHKAQYARIQAFHLAKQGEFTGALELLRLLISEFPEPSQLASSHELMGDCLLTLGLTDAALDAYRSARAVETQLPNVRTNVWLKFPWVVVTKGLRHLYSEAREFLIYGKGALFPIQEYRLATIEAYMAADQQDHEAAKSFARMALAAAQKTHSGFRYHPQLGLVEHMPAEVKDRLVELAQ